MRLGVLLIGLLWSMPALGQTLPGDAEVRTFSADRMRLMSDPESQLGVVGSELGRKGDWDAALWMHYLRAPLTLNESSSGASRERRAILLGNQAAAVFTASYAILDNLRVHTRMKTVPLQTRSGDILTDLGFGSLPSSGTGDPVLGVRFQGLDGEASFAFGFEATAPIGSPKDAYIAESGPTFRPEILFTLPAGPIKLNVNTSLLFREPTTVPEFSFNVSDELNASVMAGYEIRQKTGRVINIYSGLEMYRGLNFEGFISNESGLEGRAGVDFGLSNSISIRGGVGAAIDGAVGVPDLRVFAGAVAYNKRSRAKGPKYESLGEFAVCVFPREQNCDSNDPLCIAQGPPYCEAREGAEGEEGIVFQLGDSNEDVEAGIVVEREWWEKIEPLNLCDNPKPDETTVFFPVGNELDTAAYRKLDRFVATLLQAKYQGPVQTTGHDTAKGAEDIEALNDRKRLAFARARTVRNYLVFRGLNPDQMLPYQAALSPANAGTGVLRAQKSTFGAPQLCQVLEDVGTPTDAPPETVAMTVALTKKGYIWVDGKREKRPLSRKKFEVVEGSYVIKVKYRRRTLERKVSLLVGRPIIVRFDFDKQSSTVRSDRSEKEKK